ncbi:DNA helicase [Sarracenia purpurea var. burkii]
MTAEQMAEAVDNGGVALQEIISANLVSEGQLIRLERGMANSGAKVNWVVLDETAKEYGVGNYAEKHKGENKPKWLFKMAQKIWESKTPLTSRKCSKLFHKMLLAIKADAVADRAIQRLKEGKKPVIAFANTMESFIKELEVDANGKVNIDFSQVLIRGLEGVMRIQINDGWGKRHYSTISLDSIGEEGIKEYNMILNKIKNTRTGVSISPIDYVKKRIQAEGFKVGEVTGRSFGGSIR